MESSSAFNAACESAFGYTAAEVVGKNVSMLMPEEVARMHNSYLEAYQSTKKKRVLAQPYVAVTAQRRDGSQFPIQLSVREILQRRKRSVLLLVASQICQSATN